MIRRRGARHRALPSAPAVSDTELSHADHICSDRRPRGTVHGTSGVSPLRGRRSETFAAPEPPDAGRLALRGAPRPDARLDRAGGARQIASRRSCSVKDSPGSRTGISQLTAASPVWHRPDQQGKDGLDHGRNDGAHSWRHGLGNGHRGRSEGAATSAGGQPPAALEAASTRGGGYASARHQRPVRVPGVPAALVRQQIAREGSRMPSERDAHEYSVPRRFEPRERAAGRRP